MTLPKELTTVTLLSKTLALIMFITLPFIGFFLGARWQAMQMLPVVIDTPSSRSVPDESVKPTLVKNAQLDNTNEAVSLDPAKRIVYIKNQTLFSMNLKGESSGISGEFKDIDTSKIMASIVSLDSKSFYFSYNGNIWSAKTDGTLLKKITSNPSDDLRFQINFIGINEDGTKLLFAYDKPVGLGELPFNPNIKYGVYAYTVSSDKTTFLYENYSRNDYIFTSFIDDKPIYANTADSYYYELNIDNGSLDKFIDMKIPGIGQKVFIDTKKKTIVYNALSSSPTDSYSQIVLIDYRKNSKIEITPKGGYAKFQCLHVSPSQKYIFYCEKTDNLNTFDLMYYVYNATTKKSTRLNVEDSAFTEPFLWESDEVFFFNTPKKDPSGYSGQEFSYVYKYDIPSNKRIEVLDGVTKVIDR